MLELNAQIRNIIGKKVKTLRNNGLVPAILYGADIKSAPLQVEYKDLEKIYKEAGENTIVKLKVKGGKKNEDEQNILIHDIERDPLTEKFIHVDFYAVRMDKLITAHVPLVFEGTSSAVDVDGGVLVKNLMEIEVEALPANLPHEIKIDISMLKTFNDLIYIKDLKIPNDVKILARPEDIVVSVVPPRSEEELASLEGKIEEKAGEVEVVGEKEKELASEEAGEQELTKKEKESK